MTGDQVTFGAGANFGFEVACRNQADLSADGSGYALIYLNGPPPGVQITVTVGGATCTTSD